MVGPAQAVQAVQGLTTSVCSDNAGQRSLLVGAAARSGRRGPACGHVACWTRGWSSVEIGSDFEKKVEAPCSARPDGSLDK